jgi:hypothetical protein
MSSLEEYQVIASLESRLATTSHILTLSQTFFEIKTIFHHTFADKDKLLKLSVYQTKLLFSSMLQVLTKAVL